MPEQAKSIPEVTAELWDLTKSYAKQETVDPLLGVGRYLGYGIAAAVIGGVGFILLLLAALRALQTETGTAMTGSLSWLPYVIVVCGGALLVAYALLRIQKKKGL